MGSPNPGPIINRPGLDPSSVDTFQRVRFCLPCQMKCIPTLTIEALSIFSRRHFHFFFCKLSVTLHVNRLLDSHEMFSIIFSVKY